MSLYSRCRLFVGNERGIASNFVNRGPSLSGGVEY
jgi:hypothetical protein